MSVRWITPWAETVLDDESINNDWPRFCEVVNYNIERKNDMSWLQQLKEPESGSDKYLRIEEGQSLTVRIIGAMPTDEYPDDKGFIEGWIVWEEINGKRTPHRYRTREAIPTGDYTDKPKYWWATLVMHEGKVKIWDIPQVSIRDQLKSIERNEKYGELRKYDLVVSRQGSGLDTKYAVIANPPEKLGDDDRAIALEALETVDVEALYAGEDPFAAGSIENQVGGGEPF
jgi:hypothetical protein